MYLFSFLQAGMSPKDDSPLKDRSFDIKDFLSKLSPRRSTDKDISSSDQDISTKQQTKTFSDPKVPVYLNLFGYLIFLKDFYKPSDAFADCWVAWQ